MFLYFPPSLFLSLTAFSFSFSSQKVHSLRPFGEVFLVTLKYFALIKNAICQSFEIYISIKYLDTCCLSAEAGSIDSKSTFQLP